MKKLLPRLSLLGFIVFGCLRAVACPSLEDMGIGMTCDQIKETKDESQKTLDSDNLTSDERTYSENVVTLMDDMYRDKACKA